MVKKKKKPRYKQTWGFGFSAGGSAEPASVLALKSDSSTYLAQLGPFVLL